MIKTILSMKEQLWVTGSRPVISAFTLVKNSPKANPKDAQIFFIKIFVAKFVLILSGGGRKLKLFFR